MIAISPLKKSARQHAQGPSSNSINMRLWIFTKINWLKNTPFRSPYLPVLQNCRFATRKSVLSIYGRHVYKLSSLAGKCAAPRRLVPCLASRPAARANTLLSNAHALHARVPLDGSEYTGKLIFEELGSTLKVSAL